MLRNLAVSAFIIFSTTTLHAQLYTSTFRPLRYGPRIEERFVDSSFLFTETTAILHGRDTLYCDSMIHSKNNRIDFYGVKITGTDGLVIYSEHMHLYMDKKNK